MSDTGTPRKAKDELKRKIRDEPWFMGIGVERGDDGLFYLRVVVRTGELAAAKESAPDKIYGVSVICVEAE